MKRDTERDTHHEMAKDQLLAGILTSRDEVGIATSNRRGTACRKQRSSRYKAQQLCQLHLDLCAVFAVLVAMLSWDDRAWTCDARFCILAGTNALFLYCAIQVGVEQEMHSQTRAVPRIGCKCGLKREFSRTMLS